MTKTFHRIKASDTPGWSDWRVTIQNQMTGIFNSRNMELPDDGVAKYISGAFLIQDAFPSVSTDNREFMISGITPEEWKQLFG